MKVDVERDYAPIKSIRLRLLSADMMFRCIIPPNPNEKFLDPFEEPNETEIIFNDTREIDNLIQMLERFRDECYNHICVWERRKR